MSTSKKNLNKEIIALFSGQSSILTVPKLYVQLTGNYSLALVLNQCVFWSNKSSLQDGWFHKKYEDWFEEIHIPERTLRRRFIKLSERGWVKTKTKMVNGLNTMHFQPDMEKIIESIENLLNNNDPNRPLCPDGSNNEPNSCTKVVPCGQLGRTESATLAGSTIYTEENKQIINPIHTADAVSKSKPFGLKEMLNDNPFGIPEKVLADWLVVRNGKRAKMTSTAWEQVNENIRQLKLKGLDPIFCFKTAVARGWVCLEIRFYSEYLDDLNNVKTTKDDRLANEAKIRERELKSQEDKRKEIDAAKGFNGLVQQISSRPDLKELQLKQEKERMELGLTGMEYLKHVIKNSNDKGMSNNHI